MLYAYRVLMTGIHLLQSGEVEANLPRLNEQFRLPLLDELIDLKTEEKIGLVGIDWPFHASELDRLERAKELAFAKSLLPEERDRAALSCLLVRWRLELLTNER